MKNRNNQQICIAWTSSQYSHCSEKLSNHILEDIKGNWLCKSVSILIFSLHKFQILYDQKVLGIFCGRENSSDIPAEEPVLSQGNRLNLI